MKALSSRMKRPVSTVSGKTVGEIVDAAEIGDPEVIRSEHDPVEPEGSLFILKGIARARRRRGQGLRRRQGDMVQHAECPRLRGRGKPSTRCARVRSRRVPASSSATKERRAVPACARCWAPPRTCALVTDGRFSGATHGPAIGYVTPEAARGGVIALVQDRDRISIDLAQRKLDLLVEPAEIERRRAAYVAPEPRVKRGYLKFYADHVAPASEGAVLPR
jgi:dihydroxy-acid dehydratase